MSISYPINLPSVSGIRSYSIHTDFASGRSISPYTYDTQVQEYEGCAWGIDVGLAPMERADAEEWVAALISLHGVKGTFLWGDPLGETPRGVATTPSGSPRVDGASQTGYELDTENWTASTTGILKAGDWISISNNLYKVLVDADSDGSGDATLDIFPRLKGTYADNTTIDISAPKGIFRLSDGQTKIVTIDARGAYLIGFSAVEAT